jgi:hypothetical protein
LSADKVVEEKAADLAAFGLNPPSIELTITKKDGKTEKLLVGDETPTGSGAYAMQPGKQQVVTIASYPRQSLEKPVADLRDKRVLAFNSDKLTSVEIALPGGRSFGFGKNNANEWQIVKPVPARADNFQVEELIRKLKEMQMMPEQDDDAKNTKEYAGSSLQVVARVTDAGGTSTLEIRRSAMQNSYAKSSTRPVPVRVDFKDVEAISKGLEDYRNKKLFDFGFNDPNRIEIRDGARSFVFVKGGEKWWLNGKEMDATGVQATIAPMRDLTAAAFTEGGFQGADVELVAVWNDGKKTDRVQLTRAAGGGYIGRREGETGHYKLDATPVDEIVKAAAEVKPAQPPKEEKKK